MKGVIMAGGKGLRLKPLTEKIAKPLVPIMNRPVMEYCIDWFKLQGIKEIAITLQYLSKSIIDFFGDGSKYGVKLIYFTENSPLGTAGGVRNITHFLDDTFVVISADILTDFSLQDAFQYHLEKRSQFTMITTKVSFPNDYGIVLKHGDGRIRAFIEKPPIYKWVSDQVNTGIYIIEPEIINYIPNNRYFDFSRDLFPLLLSRKLNFFAYELIGYWIDIGQFSTYLNANRDILGGKLKVKMDLNNKLKDNVWIGSNSDVNPEAIVEGPALIGSGCKIESGAHIKPYSIIGNHTIIHSKAEIDESIIWSNVTIQEGARLNQTIIGSNTYIGERTIIDNQAVIGQNSYIGQQSLIGSNIKVNSYSKIPEHSVFKRLNLKDYHQKNVLILTDVYQGNKHLKKEVVYCPNHVKSKIMRLLIEESKTELIDLTEGIKFVHTPYCWTKITSHELEGYLNIYCYADNPRMATEILKYYVKQIKNYQKV
ncbi:sugar phosphate nucleotidyltransferase (plasmid) [Bacillus sp. 31A1R]|uniref:Sugar phosphate nucleotidyltransferase n=1 Tax=Robertmurraya mangrovi TaxID=3098077 RepID=A0ABU5IV35_9BACI|nr:sugar phosphate nucleotidyltransferase [Bacillus sp. 31A1R]MDZ5470993.1 sugar phosphate nucleotidyltransferase [Bacillus sp. 31A1R]